MNKYDKQVNVILVDWRNLASWTGVTIIKCFISSQFLMNVYYSLMTGTIMFMILLLEIVLMLGSLWECVYQALVTGELI